MKTNVFPIEHGLLAGKRLDVINNFAKNFTVREGLSNSESTDQNIYWYTYNFRPVGLFGEDSVLLFC